ncbi:MAG TPA: ACP S-malonyltransferase [Propylenella sp.]
MKTAFLFPGQGSQAVGMGKALAEQVPAARAVFDEVDQALGEKLSSVIFEGPEDALTRTRNAQPALMAVSIAAMRALEAEGITVAARAAYVAGHSLGEYSALAAAGSLSLGDTARLLRARGEAMQNAVPEGVGAMAALLGIDRDAAAAIAAEAATRDEVCEVANDNAPGQVVVSGHKSAVERAIEIGKSRGARRAMLLPVSAPFHCALMEPAAEVMANELAGTKIHPPSVPVVANVLAASIADPTEIRRCLVEQVTGTVRWRESIAWLGANGVGRFVEIGAGKVLTGLVRRILPDAVASAVGSPEEARALAEELAR